MTIFAYVRRDNTLKRSLYVLVLVSIIIMLPACDKVSPTPFSSSPPDSATFYSPSPTPAPTPTAKPVPTPQKGLGTVHGRVAGADGEYWPWPGTLFLAETVPAVQNPDILFPVLETNIAPAATIDPYGYFYFTDVEPKIYGIVVWTPHSSYLVSDIRRKTLYVTVKPDEIVDLGVIFTVLPP